MEWREHSGGADRGDAVIGLGGYGPRPANLPLRRGAADFSDEADVAAILELVGDAELPPVETTAGEPFVGVTTDGNPVGETVRVA